MAYSRRSVRPGYMLTTPAVGRGWQRLGDSAGGAVRRGTGGAGAGGARRRRSYTLHTTEASTIDIDVV